MSSEESFLQWVKAIIQEHGLKGKPAEAFIYASFDSFPNISNPDTFIIYQDWWLKKQEIIKSKILSILGNSKKINGRQCIVKKITKPEADIFLDENHIYGSTNSKVKLGLYFKNNLLAVATFANQRKFRNGRSAELLRFCNKNCYSVVGGLGKLISKYIKDYKPDTIMTYIDLDWGKGNSFVKIGFQAIDYKNPILFFIDRKQYLRISEKNFEDYQNIQNYYQLRNRGSVKMIKTISVNDFSS
jgi:hypothetical protein